VEIKGDIVSQLAGLRNRRRGEGWWVEESKVVESRLNKFRVYGGEERDRALHHALKCLPHPEAKRDLKNRPL
jgi:hypothetical protein